jgi:hypothetical protein
MELAKLIFDLLLPFHTITKLLKPVKHISGRAGQARPWG